MRFNGTSGDDLFNGTIGRDRFHLEQGGNDTALGGRGRDRFFLGATLTADDRLAGGSGSDRLYLDGDYTGANALVCNDDTLRRIDSIYLAGGHSYDLTLADGNISAGRGGVVNAFLLGAGDTLRLDLSAETNGNYSVLGGAGSDTIIGGQEADIFDARSGNDDVDGQDGDDLLSLGGANLFNSGDHFDGGAGTDQLLLAGFYASTIHITAAMLENVEELQLYDAHDYDVVIDDAVVAAGDNLSVSGVRFGASVDSLTLDASAETDGTYTVTGSDGNDTIKAGAGNDTINGGGGIDDLTGGSGADTLTGGAGIDRFHYSGVSQSTSTTHDTITDFDAADDFFDLDVAVDGYDGQTTSGVAINSATFDANLAVAAAGHFALVGTVRALIVHAGANGGDFDGHTFLIVDVNGDKNYTATADYVFDITGAANLSGLLAGNFI